MHHWQVLGESESCTAALRLIEERRPSLLVADVTVAEGATATLFREARQRLREIRIVLVAPASRPAPSVEDLPVPPDAILLRPFRIRQFTEALGPEAPGSGAVGSPD